MRLTPLVSVILPTYNRATTLDRAIQSVLNQTFGDFELIVVDDGSTDESCRILRRYSGFSNVRVVSSAHRGCSTARNRGLAAASAPLIAFQDSDDEWRSTKLETAVAALSGADNRTAVFYSDMLRIREDGSSSYMRSPDVYRGTLISESSLDYQVYSIGIQTAVIKRECFDRVGLFDEALPRLIDLDLFIRLSDHFEFHHHREPLVRYYASNGISTDTEALVFARRYLIKKYRARLRARRHHLAHQYLYLADALFSNGNRHHGRALTAMALLMSPADSRVRLRVTGRLALRGWSSLQGRGRFEETVSRGDDVI